MAFALLALASWATAVVSQSCGIAGEEGPGFGPSDGLGPSDSGDSLEQAVMEASQHPNITNEVQFQFTRPGASANDQNSASNQWSWRVNITEIPVANLPSSPGYLHASGDSDVHFIDTVNSLSWPSGGDLSDELARVTGNASGNAGRLCLTLLGLPDLPANITNQYDSGNDGNCANVIGASCAQAMIGRAAPNADGCNSQSPTLPQDIPECQSMFSQARCDSITTFEIANTTNSSIISRHPDESSNSTSFQSGDAFYYFATGAEAAGNHSYLQSAGQQLRILILTGAANQIVCQKVNTTDVTTSNSNGASDGGAPWYGVVASFALMALFSRL